MMKPNCLPPFMRMIALGSLLLGPGVLAENNGPPAGESTDQLVLNLRKLQQKFQADHHRPRFHLLPPEEGEIWPADPNGGIWWKGRYHLFYIFQRRQEAPPEIVHCWGHVSSVDLIHWQHHPTALDVAPKDPDQGIYSGNALVNKEGIPVLMYHGVNSGNSIALAQDDLLVRWAKSPSNPIVKIPQEGEEEYGRYDSWDPHAWLEGDNYFAIFGGNPRTGTHPALFKGPALDQMRFVREFIENDRWSEPAEDISCPDFFQLGNRHVLLCISHMRGARYFIGRWENDRFHVETHARMNWAGGGFFAPESLVDDQGRRIMWAWCMDERPKATRIASGWSSVMSLPRMLSLADDGSLRIQPVPELEQLRHHPRAHDQMNLASGAETVLDGFQGDMLELALEVPASSVETFGLKVRRTPDGAEETLIFYDSATQELVVDVSRSTMDPEIRYRTWCISKPEDPADLAREVKQQRAPLALQQGESLNLRIFIDRSILEIFANDRQCVTQRVWPTRRDATGISFFSRGGETVVTALKAWDMAATSPD